MGTLNNVCVDIVHTITKVGNFLQSMPSSPARRTRRTPGHDQETWRITFASIDVADLSVIRGEVDSAKMSGKLPWTPPMEGSDRAFRVENYEDGPTSANSFDADLVLLHLPGVPA